jgi:Cof subfamily protein (haloacid dehalogenase superfamily)
MDSSHNQFKVIITDLDGTLLNAAHKISNYTKEVFKKLYDQNYLIIVATGRHHIDAMSVTDSLGFPIYLVSSNGARIHTPAKELFYSFDIESEAIKSVLSLDIDKTITSVIFKENVWLTNQHNEKLNSFQEEMHYPPQIVDFDKVEDLSAIKLLFVDEDHDKLSALEQLIMKEHHTHFDSCFSLPICLEFMDKIVDKSHAIKKILNIENLSFQESICFGDGFNDEKMLLAAQKSLIMGNAPEKLKNKLSHLEIIDTNYNDGVAKYIAEKILL